MKFCWLKDRDRVMKAARKKKAVEFEGTRLMFFSDLSAEIQQRKRLFDGVKSRLHSHQIEFGLQFPAKMRIFHNGKTLNFFNPADAEAFIQKIEAEE
ncbi:hypothetical protein PBY51_003553 [Eleginops maclovinus]|uniref:Uncharacterized protein n=1 Tax=Eleginops maclovinus TaxID=56733 RepID=A0AAN7XY68_ELEMC|nr:hypothetical protein PBY51_003553 [Eleginops maclovinus]